MEALEKEEPSPLSWVCCRFNKVHAPSEEKRIKQPLGEELMMSCNPLPKFSPKLQKEF